MKWRSLEESEQTSDLRSLRDILAERKDLIAKYVPLEARDIHARVIEELKSQNFAAHALEKGSPAPPFTLPDQNGQLVSSTDLLKRGPLIVFFLRGRWCPFCVGQFEAMSLVAGKLKDAGASLAAISPQIVSQTFFMHDQHKPGFPLLSDSGNAVARAFGLVYAVPQYQREIYRRAFINLPFANGDESWELPIPATFVLDKGGDVVYASGDEDYTKRPEPAEIVRATTSFSHPS